MIKNNKGKAWLSTLVLLSPLAVGLALWDKLPNEMAIHWGADGTSDGFGAKAIAVFGLPLILLIAHWACLLLTAFDNRQKNQSPKALGILFWIIPILSLFVNSIVYGVALGREWDVQLVLPLLIGALFIILGNYMPKITQNRTLGIKISWTLNNEENWNKTHRFAGKVWVIGGLLFILCALLPTAWMIGIGILILLVSVCAPLIYSYRLYRQHKAAGIVYQASPPTKADKIARTISAIVMPLILVGVTIVMFTGGVAVTYTDTAFTVSATYWGKSTIPYAEIETVEYRNGSVDGMRMNGFSSARLSLGIFTNEEFGTYTRYTYTSGDAYLVIRSDKHTLIINGKTPTSTKDIYHSLTAKTAN